MFQNNTSTPIHHLHTQPSNPSTTEQVPYTTRPCAVRATTASENDTDNEKHDNNDNDDSMSNSSTGSTLSHLQEPRGRDGHGMRLGHHLLAYLPRHMLHHRPLVENARLEIKIPEVSFYPRANAVRQPSIQRVLRNFLRRGERRRAWGCVFVVGGDRERFAVVYARHWVVFLLPSCLLGRPPH